MWTKHRNRICLVERKIVYSVLFTVYSVWKPCRICSVTCCLCSESNKASDAETVCTDCRHLKQLLYRHASIFPAMAFLQTLSVVCWMMAPNWITKHLIRPDHVPCGHDYHGGKSTRNNDTKPPPNADSLGSKYRRRWNQAAIIYLNTLRYRMCSEGNRYSRYWQRTARR
jgi:hypothetical protein